MIFLLHSRKVHRMSSRTIVFVAFRPAFTLGGVVRGSQVGYFASREDIKPPWKLNEHYPEKDISGLMEFYGWETVEQALRAMNR